MRFIILLLFSTFASISAYIGVLLYNLKKTLDLNMPLSLDEYEENENGNEDSSDTTKDKQEETSDSSENSSSGHNAGVFSEKNSAAPDRNKERILVKC